MDLHVSISDSVLLGTLCAGGIALAMRLGRELRLRLSSDSLDVETRPAEPSDPSAVSSIRKRKRSSKD